MWGIILFYLISVIFTTSVLILFLHGGHTYLIKFFLSDYGYTSGSNEWFWKI